MFQVCSIGPKQQVKCLPTSEWTEQAVAHPHNGMLLRLKEEVHSDTHYKIQSWGHGIKWKKPDSKGHRWQDSTHWRSLESLDPRMQEAGLRVGEESVFRGDRISTRKMKLSRGWRGLHDTMIMLPVAELVLKHGQDGKFICVSVAQGYAAWPACMGP